MEIQLKIIKMSKMIERINNRIESLKSTLEEEIIATEVDILTRHRNSLLLTLNKLKSEFGAC